MELHSSFESFPSTVATAIWVIIITLVLYIIKEKKAKKCKGSEPPHAKGAWPIIGHLHLLGGSRLPHMVLGDLADKYGPIFTMKLGINHVLVVSNGEIAKDCFTTNDKIFATRPKSEAVELMGYNYALFGFAPYGEYWRQSRKLMVLEVLSPRRVETLGHIRVSELRAFTKDIYDAWVENKESEHSDTPMKVDMSQWLGYLMLSIMVRIILGKGLSPNDEEGIRFQKVVKKFFDLLGAYVVSDFIPYLRCLDVGGCLKAMKKTAKDLDNIFDRWLKEHKFERECCQQPEGSEAFMHTLISILEGVSEGDFPGFEHDTIVKATCQQLLVAGLDTTTLTLIWALSLLLNNPEALKIVQDEIDEHVGRERLVEDSDIKNLVYLDAVMKETLRLYPAAPLAVPHEAREDCIVGGYNIPKGTRLLLNLWKLQRDPNVWPDPLKFRPERFLTSPKDVDVKGKNFEYIPFGSGRRVCPGGFFALHSAGFILASLIQQFVLQKPSHEPIDMSESPGLTNNKATPLVVLLSPRLSSSMYCVGS